MEKKILLPGKIIITAIGAYINEFLTELMRSGIKSHKIVNQKGVIYFSIRRIDYKKVAKIAKKHHIKVRVYNKNKVINLKYGKYSGVILGMILIAVGILISQKFIWKINIYNNNTLSDSLILKSIAEQGISIGAYLDNIDTTQAEYAVKHKLKDITWIKIEATGTRVDVFVNESQDISKPEISMKTPCNVISAKDAIILETEVYSGTLMYNSGGGVSKGSVVVSGIVNDGANNLILTHANAKIIGEFTEKVQFRQEFKTTEKKLKGNKESEKELMIMGAVIPITKKVENKENKVCEEYTEKLCVLGLHLPLTVKTNIYAEYEEMEVSRTIEDVNRIIEQKLEMYCENFFSQYEILDIKKNILYDSEGITLNADIKLKGNIAVQQEILRNNR